ncbi:hypothetical protein M405DRAFT_928677 [Rhizopogon salebrosus TDB-379]|nr:hypothetical protein M405DRAFT_928677 [Rhizopogon salebrosus TDB-379]
MVRWFPLDRTQRYCQGHSPEGPTSIVFSRVRGMQYNGAGSIRKSRTGRVICISAAPTFKAGSGQLEPQSFLDSDCTGSLCQALAGGGGKWSTSM